MVHTNLVSAAAASSSRQARPRIPSSGSFHAGDLIPTLSPYDIGESSSRRRSITSLRRQSSHRYHTFPTPPPKPPSDTADAATAPSDDGSDVSPTRTPNNHDAEATPLPVKQLLLLALLSLAEQTALNSISPYLPTMVASFDEIPEGEEGLYVGLLASAFALAQLATNLLWGYLSDIVGRKPVMLLGTSFLMGCFALFGFCTRYWQVLVVHVAMGLLNGNAAVVPTCLGEVTDRTNQSRAFTWLPVMYSIGSITGPALGGLLVGSDDAVYPFLAPNIVGAALLCASVVVLGIWFDETLDNAEKKAAGAGLQWVERLCACGRGRRRGRTGSWSSRWPTRFRNGDGHRRGVSPSSSSEGGDDEAQEEQALLAPRADAASGEETNEISKDEGHKSAFRQLLNRTTVILLLTYLIFQLSNISFNSLYPIFASAAAPTGRDLPPGEIGLLLSFAGLATIVFQVSLFQPLKARIGNLGSYRGALLGVALSTVAMPFVGYLDGPPPFGIGRADWWLYTEVAIVLVVKNICAIGGLSSVMLLITNSAPSHETLGTLNGIAQTLSAAGRSVGPFISGALFTLSMHIRPKGELLSWGLFGGISLLGWLGSLAIRGDGLESADWVGDNSDASDEDSSSPPDQDPEA